VYSNQIETLSSSFCQLRLGIVLRYHSLSLSQMATYWFVIGWFDNQSAQKSKVRQVAKDVVKSEVYSQTYSS